MRFLPERLKKAIVHIFAAKTKRTATKRFKRVMKLRAVCVGANPGADAIFQFLSTHWPKLSNAIESRVIPKTNNAVELVIRRFDQHYQSFCGFENLSTAQTFLAVERKFTARRRSPRMPNHASVASLRWNWPAMI